MAPALALLLAEFPCQQSSSLLLCGVARRQHTLVRCETSYGCAWRAAVVGDQPCQQMVVQVGNRKPQVDKPGVL